MTKKKYTTVLCVTILLFVAMIAVVGIMCSYLLTYEPEGPNIPNDTVVRYDENNNPVVLRPHTDENFNFLVLGHDRAAALTDVFMLVNYNVTEGSISIMQFPRDTYVGYGVATNKINASYSTFYNEARYNGSDTPELDSLRKIADILEDALCTKISYCAIMDLDGFVSIVDILGGVEMNVPADMQYYDEDQGLYINLKAGYQTLNGEQAEQFVRFRYGYTQGDLGRQDAQKIFMSAFIKKVQESISVSKLTSLAETVLDNLYTDVTVSDFVYFGKNLISVDMSNISMFSMPCSTAGGHVIMAKSVMIDIMNEHFNVYDGDITDAIFDSEGIFLNSYDQAYINAYYSDEPVYGGTEYDAGNVNDSSIDIPRSY